MEFTPEEWAARFQERITEVVQGKAYFESVSTLLGSHMDGRIFEKGFDSSMQKHQYESTKPVWISNFANPKGGNKGKTGRAQSTSYYTSYKAYKAYLDKPSGGAFVSWWTTGELRDDFRTKVFQLGDNEVGTGVTSPINADKIKWLENKYGNIFQPTEEEEKTLARIFSEEIDLILSK